MSTPIRLVVGLGNPGKEYANTRHNAGAMFVEALAQATGQSLKPEKKFHGLYTRAQLQGNDFHLLIPTTFMNRSGLAIRALADFHKIELNQILVAHDELDLPSGTARLKFGGGHGGHNGLRDTIQQFGGNKDFLRLRLGIDHPGSSERVVGHVLGHLGIAEQSTLSDCIQHSLRFMPDILAGNLQRAMNLLHTPPAS